MAPASCRLGWPMMAQLAVNGPGRGQPPAGRVRHWFLRKFLAGHASQRE